MCAPPKLAVFVFVLTIHLAILAFAFPRLDLSELTQNPATSSTTPATAAHPASATDAKVNDRPPSTEPKTHTSPVQLHQHEEHGAEQHGDDKRCGPAAAQDLHQHSLAENTPTNRQRPESNLMAKPETSAEKPDRVVAIVPAQPQPSISAAEDPVTESGATAKTSLDPVALTKSEAPNRPVDAVSIPKPKPVATTTAKPQPQPAAVRRPTTTDSTKAGSGRMSNLRPLKDGSR